MIKTEIQFVRTLSDKKSRLESGLFVAEGDKLIDEIIDSELKIRKLYLTEDSQIEEAPNIEYVSDKEMERISQLKSANSSLALVEIPRYSLDMNDLREELTIVLDGVQNPGNLGTIIRLCDWYGIENVICSPNCADCFSSKVVQATMGAILRVKVHYTPLEDAMESIKQMGIPIYGTMLEGTNLYQHTLTSEGVVVMGSEGQGVSVEVARYFDHKLFIPPYPIDKRGSESLNVAVATAILCSEFRRPR